MTADPQALITPPLPNSYWVVPGVLLAGEYPGGANEAETDQRIDTLLQAGIDAFVDLTIPGELPPYHLQLPLSVEYDRRPIIDHGTPENYQYMSEIVELIADSLRRRRVLYVHCRAGIGRTGTTMACYLAHGGLAAEAALERLNELWLQCARAAYFQVVPETPEQAQFVHDWARMRAPAAVVTAAAPVPDPDVTQASGLSVALHPQQRYAGTLLGLAVGEALAAATQGLAPGSFAPVTGMQGGGPGQLPRGAWGDDTALALCLADSLLARAGYDSRDQVARYQRWQTEGYLSSTGLCIGLEPNTAKALGSARWRRQMYAGSHDPRQLDPEPLVRVAPLVLYFRHEPEVAVERAAESARTIAQTPVLLSAMRCAALVLLRCLDGLDRGSVLALERRALAIPAGQDGARLSALVDGAFRSRPASELRPTGDAIDVLECALWVFWHSRDFRDAALRAANLGGRSDVIGALVGQFAGARGGVGGIPAEWLGVLARRELIAEYAERMYAAAQSQGASA